MVALYAYIDHNSILDIDANLNKMKLLEVLFECIDLLSFMGTVYAHREIINNVNLIADMHSRDQKLLAIESKIESFLDDKIEGYFVWKGSHAELNQEVLGHAASRLHEYPDRAVCVLNLFTDTTYWSNPIGIIAENSKEHTNVPFWLNSRI